MKRVFVYEFLSGGGRIAGDADDGLLAMGTLMRDAVAADLLGLADYAVTVAACSAAPAVPQGAAPVQPREGESAFDFVARQADAHPLVWVIAPETGGVLAQLRQRVDPSRWLGCDAAAIALTSGKRATLMRLVDAGIVTPLAFEHAPEVTRWVVKPDDGAGAIDTRLHSSFEAAIEDWSQRSRSAGAMAIEPWVEGEALSLSLLCRAAHCELLSVNRQQIAVDTQGEVSYQGVEVNVLPIAAAHDATPGAAPRAAVLDGIASRVARAVPGLRGFVGIDLVWHAQRGPVVIEINPRVTCAYIGLSRSLGRNLAAEVIAAAGAEALR